MELFREQVHHERDGHANAANADEPLDELVAFFALRETAEIAAEPGACGHDNRNGPVDFPGESECNRAYDQEHVRECVLDGVYMNRVEAGVTREAKNLYKADAHLHNASVDGDGEKSDGAFDGEFFGRVLGRLSENVLAQVAHDHHKANHDGENCLEELVSNADQEACAKQCAEECRQQKLHENFLVQIAVTREVKGAAEISDDESNAVCSVCDSGGKPEENHDGEAKRGAAACDAVDEAYDCTQNKERRVLGVIPPVCHLASSFSINFLLLSTLSRCVVSGNSARHLSSGAMASFSNFFFFSSSVCFRDFAKICDVVLRCLLQ